MEVFDRGEHFAVIGTLHEQRPWADGSHGPRDLHRMELGIVVRRADLCIVDAVADMHQFPHVECLDIEDSFGDLVGLSVARGYSHAVQERFGRERGCSHLEFLARALGPAAIQALSSAARRRGVRGRPDSQGAGPSWLTDTCHIWAEGGIGFEKEQMGWRPGRDRYPVPSVVELRRRPAGD